MRTMVLREQGAEHLAGWLFKGISLKKAHAELWSLMHSQDYLLIPGLQEELSTEELKGFDYLRAPDPRLAVLLLAAHRLWEGLNGLGEGLRKAYFSLDDVPTRKVIEILDEQDGITAARYASYCKHPDRELLLDRYWRFSTGGA